METVDTMAKYIYQESSRTFEKIPKYIYQRRNGWFEIRKKIGGVLVYWGSFPTLEEAKQYRKYYMSKNWEVNPCFKRDRYISFENGCYQVIKIIDGVKNYFGSFHNYNDAKHERDICMACNWDFNLIVEYDDSDSNYCWLGQPIDVEC